MKKLIYKIAFKIIAKRLCCNETQLTPEYLFEKGWIPELDLVRNKTFIVEPNIKDRDKVSIEFEAGKSRYRVWHGKERTFIALETSIEWIEMYMLLMDKHQQR